ncbi:phosphate binding protein [Methanobacterium lacus]|uniref:Phosphate binding protein n=1 Tax=Methanobacterium lacus (strain AL-21) TaxID=877455 RepID=F0T9I1_METLA|nr:phosphate ABC transporter substrate-binding protein [Methanobacterium lacus]ADZ08729.1 phosphate binding protein [Methanobacterium lacus]
MDKKYIIGIIIALVVIVGAYMVVAPGSGSKVTVVGSTSVQPVAEKLATAYMKEHPNVKITVQGGGTAVGIKSAQDGTANIGTASKALSTNDSQGLTQYTLGQDGVVAIVSPNNNLTGLTKDQLKGIFSGNITNWNQVGGPDAKINVIVREEGSGTRDAFQDIVLGKLSNGTKVSFVSSAIVQSSTQAVQQAVSQDPNAIGFCSFADLGNDTKALSINGISASASTIADGTYTIQRPFLFLVKGDAKGEVKNFIDWVMGPEGQAILTSQKIIKSTNSTNSTK